jgi:hypothetical protein
MAKITYTTMSLPQVGFGAFSPIPAMTPTASTGGLRRLAFYPGTTKVPSPAPQFPVQSGDYGGRGNTVRPSNAGAGDWFLPAIGIPYADNMAPPVAIQCDNVLPAPIPNPLRVAKAAPLTTRKGGRTATAWPRPMTAWPTYNGGTA